jgi:hypothetical protein
MALVRLSKPFTRPGRRREGGREEGMKGLEM